MASWATGLWGWLGCLAVLIIATTASASDKREDRARSLTLFKESAAHYEAGRYAVAAALLEEAYALHPEPKLLYNLGRAREAAGDAAGALDAYETFLREDAATDRRSEVELRMAQLRSALPAPEPAAGATTGGHGGDVARDTAPPPMDAAASTGEPRSTGAPRYIPWTLLSSGVALLGTATALGILARGQQRDADREPVQAEAAELQRQAERKALAANVLFGAGGALTVTGAAWLWIGRRRSAKQAAAPDVRAWSLRIGPSDVHCIVSF